MFNTSMPSLSDIAAVTKDNDGFGGNNGWWILIILFALFGGWGNRGWSNDTNGEVQRGFDTAALTRQINAIGDGIASLGYDQLAQMNGINQNITGTGYTISNAIQQDMIANMQQANALQAQLSNCCCQNREAISQVRYDMATDTCAITNAINQASQNIMQNDNANYRQLHDELVQSQMEAKDNKISELQSQVCSLTLAASQQAQNAYLINQIRPSAIPAYIVANPYGSNTTTTTVAG